MLNSPTALSVATIQQCERWEQRLADKGYVCYPHPNYSSQTGLYLWVKPGHTTFSIARGDYLEKTRKHLANSTTPIPDNCSIYWSMKTDLSYLFDNQSK